MLTDTEIQRADAIAETYFALAEAAVRVASAKPSLTGYCSSCCEASVRPRKVEVAVGQPEFICTACDRPCFTRSWHSLPGMSGKGGWDPSRTEQWIYCNPTPSRNTGAEDERQAARFDRIRTYLPLFATPATWHRVEWERALIGWRVYVLHCKSFEGVAEEARRGGADMELWSVARIAERIHGARRAVLDAKVSRRKVSAIDGPSWQRKSRDRLRRALEKEEVA